MNSNDHNLMDSHKNISISPTNSTRGNITQNVIVILFFLVIVILLFYDRCYLLRSTRHQIRRHSPNHHATIGFDTSIAVVSIITSRGLDPAVVKSLPVFTFYDATHKDPIDCTVCLSELEDGESGRVLPNCKHAFHVECIDMWFHSHSTCPLCRSLVEPLVKIEASLEEHVAITIPPEPVSATEPGLSS